MPDFIHVISDLGEGAVIGGKSYRRVGQSVLAPDTVFNPVSDQSGITALDFSTADANGKKYYSVEDRTIAKRYQVDDFALTQDVKTTVYTAPVKGILRIWKEGYSFSTDDTWVNGFQVRAQGDGNVGQSENASYPITVPAGGVVEIESNTTYPVTFHLLPDVSPEV